MSVSDTVWDHLKTGKRYRILDFYINEADLTPYVRYQEDGGGGIFGRACAIFFDGRFVPVERDVLRQDNRPGGNTGTENARRVLALLDAKGAEITIDSVVYFSHDPEMQPLKVTALHWNGYVTVDLGFGQSGTHPATMFVMDHDEKAPTAEGEVEGMRVEDSQGTALRIGDWVRLEAEYTEDTKRWPHTNPFTPARIIRLGDDGFVTIEDISGMDDPTHYQSRALRFVKRKVDGGT